MIPTVMRSTVPWALLLCFCHTGGDARSTWGDLIRVDTLHLYAGQAAVGMMTEEFVVDSSDDAVVDRTTLRAVLPGGTGEGTQLLHVEEERVYDMDGSLRHARQKVTSESGVSEWHLRPEGSRWMLAVTAGGRRTEREVQGVAGRIDNARAVYHGVRRGDIRVGDAWCDTSFDLTSATAVVGSVLCVAKPQHPGDSVWEFRVTSSLSGTEERWLVSGSGRTLLREVKPLLVGVAPDYEEAAAEVLRNSQGPALSFGEVLAVPVDNAPGQGTRVLLGLERPGDLHPSVRRFYTAASGGYLLRRQPARCPDSLSPAGLGAVAPALTAPTATIQCDHESIVALADSVAGSLSTVCAVVDALNRFVYTRIRKRNVATFSSAVETLKAGYGDCGEHAVLLAALLRARGVPARVLLGLVYLREKRAYLGHAWVGMETPAGWLYADPARGRFPVTTGLVPLVVDDDGTGAMHVLKLIGRTRIDHSTDGE
jgi:hypothetical protein